VVRVGGQGYLHGRLLAVFGLIKISPV
jgi:hypothetical protein